MYMNEKHKEIVENRGYGYIGTYERNEYTINKKIKMRCKDLYVRIKCMYCGNIYDIQLARFESGANCSKCCNYYENSIAYYIECELGINLYDIWDFDKNTVSPYHISKRNNKKIWRKCIRKSYHDSFQSLISDIKTGDECPYCSHRNGKCHPKDSFMQYHIDNTDPNFEEKYISKDNTADLWHTPPSSKIKGKFVCQDKDYHDDYELPCAQFTLGQRCRQCSKKELNIKDSYGYIFPIRASHWDYNKNEKTPYDYFVNSKDEVWHKCEQCGKSFKKRLDYINQDKTQTCLCNDCSTSSLGETSMIKIFKKYKIYYISQKKYKGLYGTNKGNLSYDFLLPDYNLLIEFQGIQHSCFTRGFHRTKKDFQKQLEHDRRKFNYAIDNNIDILYLYYWQINEIENILKYELQIED